MRLSSIGNSYGQRDYLEEVAKAAFSVLQPKKGDIEVKLANEKTITKLNKDYRQINEITDVLSFLIEEEPFLGQIFICYNRARKQAKDNQVTLKSELGKLLIHGILHLYGYDHINDKDYRKMETEANLILTRMGK